MDNNELESLLKEKFKPLQALPPSPSLVPKVMSSVAAMAPPELLLATEPKHHDWVLAVALVLGAAISLTSLGAIEQQALSRFLSVEMLGGYARLASTLLLPTLIGLVLLPVTWLLIED